MNSDLFEFRNQASRCYTIANPVQKREGRIALEKEKRKGGGILRDMKEGVFFKPCCK